MALSNKTIQKLSNALTSEVVEYIENDERYAEFMMEVIPDAVSEKLGSHDAELIAELSMCIMENIMFETAPGVSV
jgi:hypothetical protein